MGSIVYLCLAFHYTVVVITGDILSYPFLRLQILSQTLDSSKHSIFKFFQIPDVSFFPLIGRFIVGVFPIIAFSFLKVLVTGFSAYAFHGLSFRSYDTKPFYYGKLNFFLFFYPLEVSLTKIMFGLGKGKSFYELIQVIILTVVEEGFFGLYAGVFYAIPEFFIYSLITYYVQKRFLEEKKRRNEHEKGILKGVIIADLIATFVSYSLNTLKRRAIVSSLVDKDSQITLASDFWGIYNGILFKVLMDLIKNFAVHLGREKIYFSVN